MNSVRIMFMADKLILAMVRFMFTDIYMIEWRSDL